MIKIEKVEVMGWEHAIRGMRNPRNSWKKSDSYPAVDCGKCGVIDRDGVCRPKEHDCSKFECFEVGPNDHELMMKLTKAGSVHAKYRRMITVYADITAPLYWWKEFDTYKVGTVANSCSSLHDIRTKGFTYEDFSHEHLLGYDDLTWGDAVPMGVLDSVISALNGYRAKFLETKDKTYWWQMIQLLPSSYNQKRTVMLNYEVLAGIYPMRKDHKLDEWQEFCRWIKQLPHSEIVTCDVGGEGD